MSETVFDVFLSHSARDAELARALVELLRSALSIPTQRIRCTSVPGCKLQIGADTNQQLRREVLSARAFVALITEVSIESAYVLFELGARWGSDRFLAPLLGGGAGPGVLAGPLKALNALQCNQEDLLQFVRNIGDELDTAPESTEAYIGKIGDVVGISDRLAEERAIVDGNAVGTTQADSVLGESGQYALDDFQVQYLTDISRPRHEGSIFGDVDEDTGRNAARYQEAIRLFEAVDVMRYSGGSYKLTTKGWQLADQLWALKILDALDVNRFMNRDDLAEAVGLTDGQTELEELERHIDRLEGDGFIKAMRNMHGWSVRIVQKGIRRRKHRPIRL